MALKAIGRDRGGLMEPTRKTKSSTATCWSKLRISVFKKREHQEMFTDLNSVLAFSSPQEGQHTEATLQRFSGLPTTLGP